MSVMDAMNYEFLVRRANDCARNRSKGADADIFRALEHSESRYKANPNAGDNQEKYLASLYEVKKFTVDALNKGIDFHKKQRHEQKDIDVMLECITLAKAAKGRMGIAEAITKGLDIFVDLKIPDWK
jgi:hypothetical protein